MHIIFIARLCNHGGPISAGCALAITGSIQIESNCGTKTTVDNTAVILYNTVLDRKINEHAS